MKKIGIILLLLLFATESGMVFGQEKKSKKERQQEQTEKVKKLVAAQDYVFVAQKALPMTGRMLDLTSGYDLYVSKDTITAYLPYFGRAYVAPMDNTESGIKFESKEFDYKLEDAKKGGWNVYITPKDGQRRYDLMMRITSSGSASLTVNDDTRQSITFNGYIDDRKSQK